jgi:hypothetical protein
MTTADDRPHPPAEPQRAGGGGTEPDPGQTAQQRPEPSGSGGVDLKTSELPDPDR